MRRGGLGYGPLSMPECEKHFQAALELTMQTYNNISATDLLDEVMQLKILNSLLFPSSTYNAKERAKKWPWWNTQNDSLSKIILGTYKGNSLPLPFTNSKRRTPDDDEDAEVHGHPGKSARRKQGTTGVKPDGQWNVNRHRSTGRRRWSSREDPS